MPDMVKVENLKKNFGDLEVLKDISLPVKEGEKLVIIGPSGSGKSTFIRCINYLEEPTSGSVTIAGTKVTKKNHLEMAKKYSSMVFQQFNLYPHLTVLENLTLAPMKLQGISKAEARLNAMNCLERVGLKDKAQCNYLVANNNVLQLQEHFVPSSHLFFLMSQHQHLILKWCKRC